MSTPAGPSFYNDADRLGAYLAHRHAELEGVGPSQLFGVAESVPLDDAESLPSGSFMIVWFMIMVDCVDARAVFEPRLRREIAQLV